MILVKNTQRSIPINTGKLKSNIKKILHLLKYDDFDISVWITTDATIKKYNKAYRNKNKPTDILSFPYHETKAGEKIKVKTDDDKNLGDIIISAEYVKNDASNWNQTFSYRINVLLAHGISHLLGYDHQTESEYKKMQKFETKLITTISELHTA